MRVIVGGHLAPGRAAVVGAIEAEVADDEDALRVGVHSRRRPTCVPASARQPAAGDLLPGDAAVGGLVDASCSSGPCAAPPRPPPPAAAAARAARGGGVVRARSSRRSTFGVSNARASFWMPVCRRRTASASTLLPPSVVRNTPRSSLLRVDVALRGDEHDVRIARIDEDRSGSASSRRGRCAPRRAGIGATCRRRCLR